MRLLFSCFRYLWARGDDEHDAGLKVVRRSWLAVLVEKSLVQPQSDMTCCNGGETGWNVSSKHTVASQTTQILEVKSVLNHFIVKCYAGKASFLLEVGLFFFFYWHNTFVQTSFKNINKLEPLRLTWQKPIIKCHGDEQTSLEKDLQMRCHYKISKKKKLVVTQYYQKHLNLFGINLLNFKQ